MGKIAKIALLGCFGIAAFCMIVLIALAFMVPKALDGAVEKYTDSTPTLAPTPALAEAEGEELKDRVEEFGEALEEGVRTEPLVLAEDEINYLLQEVASEEGFDGGFHVDLKPNQVSAQISVLMDRDLEIGPWSRNLRGRYVNGKAVFDVRLRDGELDLELTSFAVKDREVPGWMLGIVQDMVDESGVLESKDVREITDKLEGLEIGDGQLTVSGHSR